MRTRVDSKLSQCTSYLLEIVYVTVRIRQTYLSPIIIVLMKVQGGGVKPRFEGSFQLRRIQARHTLMRKEDNKRKRTKNRRVESSTTTDTDTNLWARSKTQLHTRGYKGSEVLVSLIHKTCDHTRRFWPGQMRGHNPTGNHYLLSVFHLDIYRVPAGPQDTAII